ncbi:MAG TPA: sodium-dependent transporter [Chryseosolibacter sp.]
MSNRGNFSGRVGFILAAAGSAVGLGNIWRFPYLAGQNGGAAFLFFYLICVFLLCYPVLVGEIAIGRASGTNAFGAYLKLGGKRWSILGMFGIFVAIFILSFYNVVAGWAFGYFLNISFGDLLLEKDFGSFFGYFVNDIINLSSAKGLANSNLIFSLLFMVATAFIVSRGIQKGIESANKIMMPSLYIILILLIGYSLTLPNAMAGVRFYLLPDFSEMNAQTVFDGLRQAFFSLSLGLGGLITYGSYLKKNENIPAAAGVIALADTSVAFLAGLMVFPLVFSQNLSPAQGPPLVFMVLPSVFQEMGPILGRLVGGSFFLLLCFAALTSTISLLEVPVAYLVDQKRFSRKKAVWFLAIAVFILGLPSMMSQGMVPALNQISFYQGRDFLTLIADLSDISLTVGGCLMCYFIGYRWRIENFNAELALGNSSFTSSFLKGYLNVTIKYVCPILLGIMSILIIIDKFWGL